MKPADLMAGDRIQDPSGKLFVVVEVADGYALVSRQQVVRTLDGWTMVQRVAETVEVERLRAEVERLKAGEVR